MRAQGNETPDGLTAPQAADTNGAGEAQDRAIAKTEVTESLGAEALGAETALADAAPGAGTERRCILSGQRGERGALIRLALGPDGLVLPDVRARAPGRGAWIGVTKSELIKAQSKGRLIGALHRAFRGGPGSGQRPGPSVRIPDDLPDRIEQALLRAVLDRLGLEARASHLLTGHDRIADAARRGQVHLLLHAADAAVDGRRKLDQAWRVGQRGDRHFIGPDETDPDAEGGPYPVDPTPPARGLVLAADRPILSQALGRDNVVHIGIVDARAVQRLLPLIGRWHAFVGGAGVADPLSDSTENPGLAGTKIEGGRRLTHKDNRPDADDSSIARAEMMDVSGQSASVDRDQGRNDPRSNGAKCFDATANSGHGDGEIAEMHVARVKGPDCKE